MLVESMNMVKRHRSRTRSAACRAASSRRRCRSTCRTSRSGTRRRRRRDRIGFKHARGRQARCASSSRTARCSTRKRVGNGELNMAARLQEIYRDDVVPKLKQDLGSRTRCRCRDHQDHGQHGRRRSGRGPKIMDAAVGGSHQDHRPEAAGHASRASPSRPSSCARAWRSAAWSRCAARACTSSSIA